MSSKPNPTSDHQVIRKTIIEFFNAKTGEFRGFDLWRHCLPYVQKKVYPDTVLRYMRELKDEGILQYEQVGSKQDSLYKIIK
jgi:hypothetical protein